MLHNPLRLPPWRFGDATDLSFVIFDYEAYSWAGRPLKPSRVPEAPAFWFPAQAAKTWQQSEEDYVASPRAAVVPDRCRPAPGRLVRRPKAVVYVGYDLPASGANDPLLGFVAGAQSLASGLEAVGAWAGAIDSFQAPSPLAAFVPPRDKADQNDVDGGGNSVTSFTPVLEPDKVVGGECLFLCAEFLDTTFPFGSVSPQTPYTNYIAGVGAFARALSPRFERFAFHAVVSDGPLSGGGLESQARSCYQQAIDACGAGYSVAFSPEIIGTAGFRSLVQSETASKIQSFFGL